MQKKTCFLLVLIPMITLVSCKEKEHSVKELYFNKELFYKWQKLCESNDIKGTTQQINCANFASARFIVYSRLSESRLEKWKNTHMISEKDRELYIELNKIWGKTEMRNPVLD